MILANLNHIKNRQAGRRLETERRPKMSDSRHLNFGQTLINCGLLRVLFLNSPNSSPPHPFLFQHTLNNTHSLSNCMHNLLSNGFPLKVFTRVTRELKIEKKFQLNWRLPFVSASSASSSYFLHPGYENVFCFFFVFGFFVFEMETT